MKELCSQIKDKNWKLGILIITWIIVMGIGATYAYNQHHVKQENLLKASLVSGEIEENDNSVEESQGFELRPGEVEKRVRFKNTGEKAVFIRVSFGETWLGKADELLVLDDTYVTLHWSDAWNDEWQLGDDGWYYYKRILKSKETTAEVLSSVEFASSSNMPAIYQNAIYQLFFTMEVVQYSEEEDVNNDALQKVFNRTATIVNDIVIWN